MQIHNFFTSKGFQITTWVVAFLIVLFITFSAGVRLGIDKASHNFERRGMMPKFMPHGSGTPSFLMERGELAESNGAAGKIEEIRDGYLRIKDKNEEERVIIFDKMTKIRRFMDDLNYKDLNVNDIVVVFGESDANGQIIAKLIRVVPSDVLEQISNTK